LQSLATAIAVVAIFVTLLFAAFASKGKPKRSEFLIHKTKWWKKQKQKYWPLVKKRLDEMQNSFPTVTSKGRWGEVVREAKEKFEEESLAVAQKLSEELQQGSITRFEIPLETRRRMPEAVERTLSYAELCAEQEATRLHLEAARLRRKWGRTKAAIEFFRQHRTEIWETIALLTFTADADYALRRYGLDAGRYPLEYDSQLPSRRRGFDFYLTAALEMVCDKYGVHYTREDMPQDVVDWLRNKWLAQFR